LHLGAVSDLADSFLRIHWPSLWQDTAIGPDPFEHVDAGDRFRPICVV